MGGDALKDGKNVASGALAAKQLAHALQHHDTGAAVKEAGKLAGAGAKIVANHIEDIGNAYNRLKSVTPELEQVAKNKSAPAIIRNTVELFKAAGEGIHAFQEAQHAHLGAAETANRVLQAVGKSGIKGVLSALANEATLGAAGGATDALIELAPKIQKDIAALEHALQTGADSKTINARRDALLNDFVKIGAESTVGQAVVNVKKCFDAAIETNKLSAGVANANKDIDLKRFEHFHAAEIAFIEERMGGKGTGKEVKELNDRIAGPGGEKTKAELAKFIHEKLDKAEQIAGVGHANLFQKGGAFFKSTFTFVSGDMSVAEAKAEVNLYNAALKEATPALKEYKQHFEAEQKQRQAKAQDHAKEIAGKHKDVLGGHHTNQHPTQAPAVPNQVKQSQSHGRTH